MLLPRSRRLGTRPRITTREDTVVNTPRRRRRRRRTAIQASCLLLVLRVWRLVLWEVLFWVMNLPRTVTKNTTAAPTKKPTTPVTMTDRSNCTSRPFRNML
ncbi:hypothetical protein BJX68DRAFT_238900, partial [Aspergillus pseudodeflectus]